MKTLDKESFRQRMWRNKKKGLSSKEIAERLTKDGYTKADGSEYKRKCINNYFTAQKSKSKKVKNPVTIQEIEFQENAYHTVIKTKDLFLEIRTSNIDTFNAIIGGQSWK